MFCILLFNCIHITILSKNYDIWHWAYGMNTHLTYLNLLIASLIVSIPALSSSSYLVGCLPVRPAATHFRWDVVNFFIFVKPIEKLAKLSVDLTLACRRTHGRWEGEGGGRGQSKAGDYRWASGLFGRFSLVSPETLLGTKNFCRTQRSSEAPSAWCLLPCLPWSALPWSTLAPVHINKELYGKWPLTTNRKTEKVEKLFEKKKWNNKQHWQQPVGEWGKWQRVCRTRPESSRNPIQWRAASDHTVIYAHEIELWCKLFMNKAHTQE